MKKAKKNISRVEDLQDYEKDRNKMKGEETTMDLPEVDDIPGQEHVRPPKFKEFADVTPSSDDEEGKGLLDVDEEDEMNNDSSVSRDEKETLERSVNSQAGKDDQQWNDSTLDNTDDEGEPLNEENDYSGKDLDVPGSEDDDAGEDSGSEDEENNSYSLGGEKE
jgi:hypothetical protein